MPLSRPRCGDHEGGSRPRFDQAVLWAEHDRSRDDDPIVLVESEVELGELSEEIAADVDPSHGDQCSGRRRRDSLIDVVSDVA